MGLAAPGLKTALVAWLGCLRAGRWEVSDPVAAQEACMPGIGAIFDDDLGRDDALAGRLTGKVALLLEGRQTGGPVPQQIKADFHFAPAEV